MGHDIRDFDIVIFGATGFTGRCVVSHAVSTYTILAGNSKYNSARESDEILLATQAWRQDNMKHKDVEYRTKIMDSYDTKLKVGFAARSLSKLEKTLASVMAEHGVKNTLPKENMIEVNANDYEALKNMARRTKVVVSTVGPFLRYGENLVRACAEEGTHYCDTTGETPFISKMERKYHKIASKNKAKIIHCCGMDSVPSDLGVLQLQEYAIKTYGTPCHKIEGRWVDMLGSFSGGTFETLMNMLESMGDLHTDDMKKEKKEDKDSMLNCKKQSSCLYDNFGLVKYSASARNDKSPEVRKYVAYPQTQVGLLGYDAARKRPLAPFVMAPANTNVVMWSNYLTKYKYGTEFSYSECLDMGFPSRIHSFLAGAALYVAMGLLQFSIFRTIFRAFVPAPGDGPTELLNKGNYRVKMYGEVKTPQGCKFVEAENASNKGDPGYHETGKMVFECAAALALNEDLCPNTYGSLSPAAALGLVLADRLNKAGMKFNVVS